MLHLRLMIIAIATVIVLALGVFALVNGPAAALPGDDIIIKGGSLEIQCGSSHGNDCLGTNDNAGKYKHKQSNKHIIKIVVRDSTNQQLSNNSFEKDQQPTIIVTYK